MIQLLISPRYTLLLPLKKKKKKRAALGFRTDSRDNLFNILQKLSPLPRSVERFSWRVPRAGQSRPSDAPGAPPAGAAPGSAESGHSEMETTTAHTVCQVKAAGAYKNTYGEQTGCL